MGGDGHAQSRVGRGELERELAAIAQGQSEHLAVEAGCPPRIGRSDERHQLSFAEHLVASAVGHPGAAGPGGYQAWVSPQCGQPTEVDTGASNT